MADLMQKTKKELIIMLQDMEMAMQSLQNEPRRLQGELEKALSENDQIQNEVRRTQEVAFLNPMGGETQIDLKLMRVRYRDKPSIKMTIK